ncbi:hypothetical protein FGG08_001504 [Glutinoglossum americanum]|uniref:Peroxisomal biogenesis factor 11 n=1 Tax=Glutinoglossum americanum TaxID=1670608 RepID=A0A9P8L072_9PEZI|nr:hypothetical protein FGG08_001504 [Glutinoglossum americanum]
MASLPAPSGGSFPKANQLKKWLPLYLKRADVTIAHLDRHAIHRRATRVHEVSILSTSAGTDATLCAVNYILVTVISKLDWLSRRRLEKAALAVATQVDGKLLPGETLIATISQDPKSGLALTSKRLRALSDLVADFRIFMRLWGMLGIWKWGSELWKEPPKDRVLKCIAWVQVGAGVAYQYLENGAYLAQHGVIGLDARRQTRWWVWSSRLWMAHVALDFGRLWRERMTREVIWDSEEKEGKIQRAKREEKWWREAYINAAYAPLTLHWSRENGAVGEMWVGILGSIAGIIGFREMWRSTS